MTVSHKKNHKRKLLLLLIPAVVQVVLQDEVIGISGRLEPGYQVRELSLDKKLKLSPGEYEGKLQVYFYDPATDERAMVNASIPVSITVKKR